MKLREITNSLEKLAPLSVQESYDNCGLLIGDPDSEVRSALLSLDCTEAVVEEAVALGCQLIVAHHPLIFSGLKKITGRNYVERTVMRAIREGVAIYAIHTNLDNVRHGVNKKIAEKIGLKNTRILAPRASVLNKLAVFVPETHAESVREALFSAGAGHIGHYDQCSFNTPGTGTFRGDEQSNPWIGRTGELHTGPEVRIEVILPEWIAPQVVAAMITAHPYEEVAYDLYPLRNATPDVGSGLIGELENPMDSLHFLNTLKKSMNTALIRHTALCYKEITKIAVCGGSGSFLLPQAISEGAHVLVTADFKYHQFFDAEGRIIVADIGHFESEQFTPEIIAHWLGRNFPTFATHFSRVNTNPINYL